MHVIENTCESYVNISRECGKAEKFTYTCIDILRLILVLKPQNSHTKVTERVNVLPRWFPKVGS